MTISSGDIEAIVQMFEQSKWKEIELQVGNCELFMSKDATGRPSWATRGSSAAHAVPHSLATVDATPHGAPTPRHLERGNVAVTSKGPVNVDLPEGCVVLPAPSLGTFYRAAKPGAAPFIELGQRVDEDTELCLIEVMKLFTTLRAEVSGVVREILVKDGDLVEYGQPLFVVDTNG